MQLNAVFGLGCGIFNKRNKWWKNNCNLPAFLPACLTQNEEIACCGPLHSRKNKKECLNEKYKPCQHKSTNPIRVPETQSVQYPFSSFQLLMGMVQKEQQPQQKPPQHAENKFTLIKVKNGLKRTQLPGSEGGAAKTQKAHKHQYRGRMTWKGEH